MDTNSSRGPNITYYDNRPQVRASSLPGWMCVLHMYHFNPDRLLDFEPEPGSATL